MSGLVNDCISEGLNDYVIERVNDCASEGGRSEPLRERASCMIKVEL